MNRGFTRIKRITRILNRGLHGFYHSTRPPLSFRRFPVGDGGWRGDPEQRGQGPSTEGIDSSSYVLVQNSGIDSNDDNFCLKAGQDWDGLRVNRPTMKAKMSSCDPGQLLKNRKAPHESLSVGAGPLISGRNSLPYSATAAERLRASRLRYLFSGNDLSILMPSTTAPAFTRAPASMVWVWSRVLKYLARTAASPSFS